VMMVYVCLFVAGDIGGSRIVRVKKYREWKENPSSIKLSFSVLLVCGVRSELDQTQHNVRQQRREESERKDGRSVLVIIPPFRAPRPQLHPSVNKDDGGVCDGEQSRKGEHRGGDQTRFVSGSMKLRRAVAIVPM